MGNNIILSTVVYMVVVYTFKVHSIHFSHRRYNGLSAVALLRVDVRPSIFSGPSQHSAPARYGGRKERKSILLSPLLASLPRLAKLVAQHSLSAGRYAHEIYTLSN